MNGEPTYPVGSPFIQSYCVMPGRQQGKYLVTECVWAGTAQPSTCRE
jgi:hypothetical protein